MGACVCLCVCACLCVRVCVYMCVCLCVFRKVVEISNLSCRAREHGIWCITRVVMSKIWNLHETYRAIHVNWFFLLRHYSKTNEFLGKLNIFSCRKITDFLRYINQKVPGKIILLTKITNKIKKKHKKNRQTRSVFISFLSQRLFSM